MKIFVSHSRRFDFEGELYKPLRESVLFMKHQFLFPHQTGDSVNTKQLIQNECDLVLAEVSYPSTGQGIELGWADDANKKIICIYKKGTEFSKSLKEVTDNFKEYTDTEELINILTESFGLGS